MRFRVMAVALVAALGLAGPASAGFQQIEGTAGYGERTALPEAAVLEVQLLDLGAGDAAPLPIASILVRVLGAEPFPFRLVFDDAMIDPATRSYALAARIRQGGETLFQTAEATPMFTGVAAGPPHIRMVRPAPPGGPAQPALELSEWVLSEMATGEIDQASPARLTFGEENQVRGTGGCNDFTASYRIDPPQGLSFGKLESTLRGCSALVAQQERLVFRALGRTKSYQIADSTLVLQDAEGSALLTMKQRR